MNPIKLTEQEKEEMLKKIRERNLRNYGEIKTTLDR